MTLAPADALPATLSGIRRGLWWHELLTDAPPARRTAFAVALPPLPPQRVDAALTQLARSHDAFRLRWEAAGDRGAAAASDTAHSGHGAGAADVAAADAAAGVPRLLDPDELPAWRADRVAAGSAGKALRTAWPQPLALTGTPYRALVAALPDGDRLVVEWHPLVADARSAEPFAAALLAACGVAPDAVTSTADPADDEPPEQPWPQRLRAIAAAQPLAPLPAVPGGGDADEAALLLDADDRVRLAALAERCGTTLAATLLAIVQMLQHAYGGGRPGTVATMAALDTRASAPPAIGAFTDERPIVAAIDGETTFDALARATGAQLAAAAAGAADGAAYLDVVARHGAGHDPRRLFPALRFDFRPLARPALTEPLHGDGRGLLLTALDDGERIALRLGGDPRLASPAAARRLLDRIGPLLRQLDRDPALPLARLELTTAAERAARARDNATAVTLPSWTVPQRVAALAARQPHAVAIEHDGDTVTYAALQARADALAARVRAAEASAVGVLLDRGPELVAALLGIFGAGATYVPLDPSLPRERLAFIVADAQLDAVVTTAALAPRLGDDAPPALLLDAPPPASPHAGSAAAAPDARRPAAAPAADAAPPPARRRFPRPGDDAYMIYTSGSTGRPKGVRITHGALANFLADTARRPGIGPGDVQAAAASPSFDLSLLDLLLPLTAGARCAIVPAAEVADGEALAERLERSGVTYLHVTPATWRLLVAGGWRGRLRVAVSGAEALTPELAAALLERSDELWNSYGPTETTIGSTLDRVLDPGDVTIGRPIANTRVHVRDGLGRAAPTGVPGELVIAGDGVARGYHRRPELTAERFLPEPGAVRGSGPGAARAYATGDLVRLRDDGRVEYLGRIDDQVKLRGHRIELGEVEAAAKALPAVRDAAVAVVARDDADRRLVAWVVPQPGVPFDRRALRGALAERLPAYMLPALFVELAALPLTPNGKVDRAALPVPPALARDRAAAGDPHRAEVEAAVAALAAVYSISPRRRATATAAARSETPNRL